MYFCKFRRSQDFLDLAQVQHCTKDLKKER